MGGRLRPDRRGQYLDAARTIFARNLGGWDEVCGGGLWWNTERTYKNAITNELFITLAAQLHSGRPATRSTCRGRCGAGTG